MKPAFYIAISLAIVACTPRAGLVKDQSPSALAPTSRVEQDIHFLASDDMRGRDTGSPELELAAEYIATAMRDAGAQVSFQSVPVIAVQEASKATVQIGRSNYKLRKQLMVLQASADIDESGAIVFAGYGTQQELASLDLKGKIVVTEAGSETETDPQVYYKMAFDKQERIAAAGGVALIELFRSKQVKWEQLYNYVGTGGVKLGEQAGSAGMPLLWIHDPIGEVSKQVDLAAGTAGNVMIQDVKSIPLKSRNVIGTFAGSDSKMANDYLVVTAHYDHVGVGRAVKGDSIYNGARDNAMGTAALLEVARSLGKQALKRPVIMVAFTAEEKGLLGSEYYVANVTVPLNQIAFNLNFDGAGYDDTTAVTINGYGRSSVQSVIDAAVAKTGVVPKPDPVPNMNLFQYSDNWNFAKRGIPAINLAPGFTGFSPELMQYYHQPPDEVAALNFDYVRKYCAAAVAAARAIGNTDQAIRYQNGDELRAVSDELYQR